MEQKTFWCANNHCSYHSKQPIEKSAQELDGHILCQECYNKGLRLNHGIVLSLEKRTAK